MMASTSDSSATADQNSSLIEQFCSVTGSNRDKAIKMLEACNWNLEMAINMHVDSDLPESDVSDLNNSLNTEDTDSVRPPIPQSRAVLVENDLNYQYGLRGRKRKPHSVFDPFRNFETEARLQELSVDNSETFKKRRTLEDLFRPPLDIMHRGTFESARDFGQISNRWLMVNIQNSQEFSCQVLNRDIWSNQAVKNIISEHFVFWQVYIDSIDGQRYMQFYKPVEFPYIAIIDPRTGEKLVVWHKVDSTSIFDLVSVFLKQYCSPNTSSESVSEPSKKFSLLDQSEEYQLKAALAASMKESTLVNDDNDSDLETFGSDSENDKILKIGDAHLNSDHSNDTIDVVGFTESTDQPDSEIKKTWKDFLGHDEDPKTDLVIRFPDGKKEQVSWPCTTKIKSLLLYIDEFGYDLNKYELVTNYPRRNLCQLDVCKTLTDVDLFPREMVFVQLKS